MKNNFLEEINKAILILLCNKEKVTNKRISEVSGLSLRTVTTYRKKDANKKDAKSANVQPNPTKVQPVKEKVQISNEPKQISYHSEAFLHCLKRRVI
jgi:hypothetical protein